MYFSSMTVGNLTRTTPEKKLKISDILLTKQKRIGRGNGGSIQN